MLKAHREWSALEVDLVAANVPAFSSKGDGQAWLDRYWAEHPADHVEELKGQVGSGYDAQLHSRDVARVVALNAIERAIGAEVDTDGEWGPQECAKLVEETLAAIPATRTKMVDVWDPTVSPSGGFVPKQVAVREPAVVGEQRRLLNAIRVSCGNDELGPDEWDGEAMRRTQNDVIDHIKALQRQVQDQMGGNSEVERLRGNAQGVHMELNRLARVAGGGINGHMSWTPDRVGKLVTRVVARLDKLGLEHDQTSTAMMEATVLGQEVKTLRKLKPYAEMLFEVSRTTNMSMGQVVQTVKDLAHAGIPASALAQHLAKHSPGKPPTAKGAVVVPPNQHPPGLAAMAADLRAKGDVYPGSTGTGVDERDGTVLQMRTCDPAMSTEKFHCPSCACDVDGYLRGKGDFGTEFQCMKGQHLVSLRADGRQYVDGVRFETPAPVTGTHPHPGKRISVEVEDPPACSKPGCLTKVRHVHNAESATFEVNGRVMRVTQLGWEDWSWYHGDPGGKEYGLPGYRTAEDAKAGGMAWLAKNKVEARSRSVCSKPGCQLCANERDGEKYAIHESSKPLSDGVRPIVTGIDVGRGPDRTVLTRTVVLPGKIQKIAMSVEIGKLPES